MYNDLLTETNELQNKIRKHYFFINRFINENYAKQLEIEALNQININNNKPLREAPSSTTSLNEAPSSTSLNETQSAGVLPPNRKFFNQMKSFFKN